MDPHILQIAFDSESQSRMHRFSTFTGCRATMEYGVFPFSKERANNSHVNQQKVFIKIYIFLIVYKPHCQKWYFVGMPQQRFTYNSNL